MKMQRSVLAAALLFYATPVLAQQAPPAEQPKASDAKVHERVICEDTEEIGSRLATSRVCMTATQWATKRRSDRDEAEHMQRLAR
ncbi:MAG: hypothetical protein ABR588_01385 [Sphingomicrobium sp.]